MGIQAHGRNVRDQPEASRSSSPMSASTEASSSRNRLDDVESDEASSEHSDSDDQDEMNGVELAKAKTKLHYVAKTLRASTKKTKAFEVQKLVKKLKGLRKKDSLASEADSAEKELEALKSLDTNYFSARALITKMTKAKLLPRPIDLDNADEDDYVYLPLVRDEDLLGEGVLTEQQSQQATSDRAYERAKAKLTSSKVLADEVGKAVEELKILIGIQTSNTAKKTDNLIEDPKGKRKADITGQHDEREWSGSSEDETEEEEALPPNLSDAEDEDDVADEKELERIGREKIAALGDLSQWDDMIAPDSTDEEDDREDGSEGESDEEEDEGSLDSAESYSSEEDDEDSDEDSDSTGSSDASSPEPSKKRKASSSAGAKSVKKAKKTKADSLSSSTFLPSLSTGFIPGDRSDDDWSDAEADLADRDLSELKKGKSERKNRMGQRARKALYEKKFGRNANHIKIREAKKREKLERGSNRSDRPAAAFKNGRVRPPAFDQPRSDGGWKGAVAKHPAVPKRAPAPQQAAPTTEPAQRKEPSSSTAQEMHPSWIAKQKQKELMAQVKPEGKKIVFD